MTLNSSFRVSSALEVVYPELKTLDWDIFNNDHSINLEINNKRR